jgi:hypothetical protein
MLLNENLVAFEASQSTHCTEKQNKMRLELPQLNHYCDGHG